VKRSWVGQNQVWGVLLLELLFSLRTRHMTNCSNLYCHLVDTRPNSNRSEPTSSWLSASYCRAPGRARSGTYFELHHSWSGPAKSSCCCRWRPRAMHRSQDEDSVLGNHLDSAALSLHDLGSAPVQRSSPTRIPCSLGTGPYLRIDLQDLG
jgi:hypothetical protein